jgi:hypothetical protein
MEEDENPESPAHEVVLDPDEEARRIILARRARFVAVALVSAGVTTAACGGQTSDRTGSPQPCLTLDAEVNGTGGAPQVCLGAPAGGAVPCLSIAMGGAYTSTGATTGAGGAPQPCLEIAPLDAGAGGSPQPCLRVAPDAGPGPSDAATDATRDAMPIPCLTPIPNLPNGGDGS